MRVFLSHALPQGLEGLLLAIFRGFGSRGQLDERNSSEKQAQAFHIELSKQTLEWVQQI